MKEKTCLNSFFFGLSSQCLFEKMSLLANSSQALLDWESIWVVVVVVAGMVIKLMVSILAN